MGIFQYYLEGGPKQLLELEGGQTCDEVRRGRGKGEEESGMRGDWSDVERVRNLNRGVQQWEVGEMDVANRKFHIPGKQEASSNKGGDIS